MDLEKEYKKEKLTIDIKAANTKGLLILLFVFLAFGIPYFLMWREQFEWTTIKSVLKSMEWWTPLLNVLLAYVVMALGVVLHEFIHALSFVGFTQGGWKSIKFGILKETFTPYCHCKEPLKVKHYIFGALTPAVVLGIIPVIAAMAIGNVWMLLFGMFFTAAAGGDFMIVDLIRKEKKDDYVQDHPSEAGCFIFRKL